MVVTKHETMEVRISDHVVLVRQAVRKWSIELGFSLVDQTKMITAASELARNTLDYGGGGT
jgi:serine/threonine-protein kinase RsbT